MSLSNDPRGSSSGGVAQHSLGPMSLAMSKAQREQFLAGVHIGVVAIPEERNGPLTPPVWYGYEVGGEIWFLTGRDSRKGKLLSIGLRVSLVAQRESAPYQYVSVEGPLTSVAASPDDAEERRLAQRYLGREAGDVYIASTAARREAEPNVLVKIRPERWLSVDYRKAFS